MRKKIKLLPGIFGTIEPPDAISKYDTSTPQGLFTFINNVMKIRIVGAGIFALINFILAGVVGLLVFGDATAILQPKLYKP